jgi:hypothetical protein
MYDLDEVDAAEDAVDEVPEFMKPDATDVDEGDAGTATESAVLDEPEPDVDPDSGRDRDNE